MESNNEIVVLGLGNILLRDEGVGVRVIEELKNKYSFSPSIRIVDGGTLGFSLINEIEGCKKLIVVDAVKTGSEPGTMYRFTRDDIRCQITQKMSAHDIGFLEVLEQWKVLGIAPEIIFLGIEPEDMDSWGMQLSACIQGKVPRLIELVIKELENAGVTTKRKYLNNMN